MVISKVFGITTQQIYGKIDDWLAIKSSVSNQRNREKVKLEEERYLSASQPWTCPWGSGATTIIKNAKYLISIGDYAAN